MIEPIIGIDLGTTNSEVAIVRDGQPIIIQGESGRIVPSYVGISDKGEILVGEPAKNQYLPYPDRTVKSIKRKMGSNETVTLGDKTFTPREISAMILKKLKGMAEAYLGQPVTKAVITVPAYFSDAQRQATRDAGGIAGLEVVRIINEPTAAALAYESDHREEKKILVYDLGGGTFDVSVVSIHEGVVEVISGHGNNHLGGDDFDNKLAEEINSRFKDEHGADLYSSTRSAARLVGASEAAKIFLSDNPFAAVQEEYIYEKNGLPLNLNAEVSRHEYEAMISAFIEETLDSVHTALKGAALSPGDIDKILLVGGSTKTPLVSSMLNKTFGLDPRMEVDPDLCVAMGAAIQAHMIAGGTVSSVLVDITPYTFGTSALGEMNGMHYPYCYVPLIEKNTAIPVSKSEVFYTALDNQERVDVHVYQGENQDAAENILIGNFLIEGLSSAPAGNEMIAKFELDIDGILHVTAEEKKTGVKKSISIDNAVSRLDNDEIDRAKMKIDAIFSAEGEEIGSIPNEDAGDELLSRAGELIIKAKASLPTIAEEDREEVVNLIEDIKDSMEKKDYGLIEEYMEELSDLFFYLEI